MLPLSAVHEDNSDELLTEVMEEQKADMEKFKQNAKDIRFRPMLLDNGSAFVAFATYLFLYM